MKLTKPYILHPFLLAIFPPLFLYAENIGELFYLKFIVLILAISLFNVCVWFVLNIFIKSRERAGLIQSALIVAIFVYSNFATLIISLFDLDLGRHSLFLIAGWLIIPGTAIWVISRLDKSLVNWTKIVNVMAICLVAMSLVKVVSVIPDQIATHRSRKTYVQENEFPKPEAIPDNLPNIYYIILDEHIGFPTMDMYEYDSSAFKAALQERDFFIAEKSRSNYCWTSVALPSLLNFKYLEIPNSKDAMGPLYYMMDNNRAFQFLKSYGYTTMQCETYLGLDHIWIDTADKHLIFSPWYLTEFSLKLFGNTPFYSMLQPLIAKKGEKDYTFARLIYKRRIEASFDAIKEAVNYDGPFILLTHIMSPHKPYIYDENGGHPVEGKRFSGISIEPYPEYEETLFSFYAQLTYIDKKMVSIIDHVKKHSKEPPVIIIQGDHGWRGRLYLEENKNKAQLTQEAFTEIFSVLNVVHLPGYDYSQLDDSISLVNTFPIIFNHYFDADFEILPNKQFLSLPDKEFELLEVTDQAD